MDQFGAGRYRSGIDRQLATGKGAVSRAHRGTARFATWRIRLPATSASHGIGRAVLPRGVSRAVSVCREVGLVSPAITSSRARAARTPYFGMSRVSAVSGGCTTRHSGESSNATMEHLAAIQAGPQWGQQVARAWTCLREWKAILAADLAVERYRDLSVPTLLLAGTATEEHPSFATRDARDAGRRRVPRSFDPGVPGRAVRPAVP